MSVSFQHVPHSHIANRKKAGPPKTTDEHVGPNGKIALVLTTVVGTMWCAYLFAALALLVLPQAIDGGLLTLIQWLSQTFIQLVMLSVIMVGQNILGRASDKRADLTYKDAEATSLGLTRRDSGRVLILAASAGSSPDSKHGMRIHAWTLVKRG